MEVFMKIAKILSLLFVLALIIGTMASCGAEELTAKQIVDNAAVEMEKTPYRVSIDLDFSTSNETYKEIVSAMSLKGIEMDVDGKNLHFGIDMDMGIATMQAEYTAVDGTVYVNATTSSLDSTQSVKRKAVLNEDQLTEFLADLNLSNDMNVEDFISTTVAKDGDTYTIACEGMTDKLNEALSEMIGSAASGISGAPTISDVSYVVNVKNNKIESAKLSCTYKVTVSDEEIDFTMNFDMVYDYDASVSITTPSDAATYTEVDYDELMGA